MIELLILFVLADREYTMYSVQKRIKEVFASFTSPSFGALNPALKKLENNGFIRCRQAMSEGGKLSCYYSITSEGITYLKKLLLKPLSKNPLQFLSNASIKLSMADILDINEKKEFFFEIKTLAMKFKSISEKILSDEHSNLSFYQKIVLDNTVCEYNNLINIIEGFEKDNARNS